MAGEEKGFDFDTWLENQPEGTFVQGGGIDNEQEDNNAYREFYGGE